MIRKCYGDNEVSAECKDYGSKWLHHDFFVSF
jgi:hypothetical protein